MICLSDESNPVTVCKSYRVGIVLGGILSLVFWGRFWGKKVFGA